LKSKSAATLANVVSDLNDGVASVRNPLSDISNVGCQSVGCDGVIDLEGDVIPIDKENVIVPDSVSPSPFRHRSRLGRAKVFT